MKHIVFILITVMSLSAVSCSVSRSASSKAETKKVETRQKGSPKTDSKKANSKKTTSKKPNPKKVDTKQISENQKLKQEIKEKDIKIVGLEQQLKKCRDSLSVYEFFNNDEVTIFTDKRLENGSAENLTGQNKTKYETIRMIVDLDDGLSKIDATINQATKDQSNQNWSDSELKNYIRLTIKKEMSNISNQLDDIYKRDLDFLSDKQMEFYKKQKQRWNKIANRYDL